MTDIVQYPENPKTLKQFEDQARFMLECIQKALNPDDTLREDYKEQALLLIDATRICSQIQRETFERSKTILRNHKAEIESKT